MSKNYFRSFAVSFFTISALMFGAFHYASANFFTDLFGGGNSASVSGSSSSSPLRVYGLRVYKSGSGTVTSDDGKINCGSNCSQSYSQNTTVTLTASPAPGFTFMGWSTGWFDRSCPGTGSCVLTMNKSRYARAYFRNSRSASVSRNPQTSNGVIQGGSNSQDILDRSSAQRQFVLNVRKSGVGNVRSNDGKINCTSGTNQTKVCSASFDNDAVVVLHPTPDAGSGYGFGVWGGDCGNTVGGNDCQLVMNKSREATVTFDLKRSGGYKLKVLKLGTGDGLVESKSASNGGVINTNIINCGADCSEVIQANCQGDICPVIQLKATADNNSTFGWWGGDCKGLTSAKDECQVSMNGDKEVTVYFNEGVANQQGTTYKLTVQKPIGGTITNKNGSGRIDCGTHTSNCSSVYGKGVTVNLVATPDAGYKFINTGNDWGGGCDRMIGSNECEIKMDRSRMISALFDKITSSNSSSVVSLVRPQATTKNAGNIFGTTATLNAVVNAKGNQNVKAYFIYAENTGSIYDLGAGIKTPEIDVAGSNDVNVSADIKNLKNGTKYVYNINVTYYDSVDKKTKTLGSNTVNFTTSSASSIITTGDATNITSTSARLSGTVKAKTGDTLPVYFIYGPKGTDQKNWKTTPQQYITGNGDISVSANISNLSPGISYDYYLSSYFEYGIIKEFKTLTSSSNSSSSSSSGSSSLDLKVREVLAGGRFGEYSDSITLNNPNSEGTESVDLKWAVPSDASNCSLAYSFNAQPLRWGQLISSEIISESGKDRTSNAYKHNTSDYNVTSSSRQTATYTLTCSSGGGKIIKATEVIFGGN